MMRTHGDLVGDRAPRRSPAAVRSYLYTPGNRPDRIAKAITTGTDAVLIDLEDSVAPSAKPAARAAAVHALRTREGGTATPPLWVRIDSTSAELDIDTVIAPALTGVWVPKAEPDLLVHIDSLLTRAEVRQGLPRNSVAIVPIIETATGVLRAQDIAAAPRVTRLGVGEADLIGELRIQPDRLRTELFGIRMAVVLASAAAGIDAPIGPVETQIADLELLAETTAILLHQGFRARTALHPRQLAIINATFTPSAADVQRARDIVQRLDSALTSGEAALMDERGGFIDPAVARSARDVLDRAGIASAASPTGT